MELKQTRPLLRGSLTDGVLKTNLRFPPVVHVEPIVGRSEVAALSGSEGLAQRFSQVSLVRL